MWPALAATLPRMRLPLVTGEGGGVRLCQDRGLGFRHATRIRVIGNGEIDVE